MESDTPSRWQDVGTTGEVISQAGRELEKAAREGRAPGGTAAAREALLAVTAAGARLARQLDMLAAAYEAPNSAEPSELNVALDQAAAAAEDLGNCAKVAAQAIVDE
ncbi:hypothetical protein AB0L88_06925 [Saccharopolyspora shandongensis]|uniref:Uncharacterized protein n=1 Tax=Saccharopolyspora shandongensis TaxID=418495 RepID=A0A1H2XR66_9PSEU|nr:hypothetical protein [Saccharopolyspora shandongensis]SDW95363.1 hypothetical protein SAMN05216215_1006176 [Saccharopolyspora shandongensis]